MSGSSQSYETAEAWVSAIFFRSGCIRVLPRNVLSSLRWLRALGLLARANLFKPRQACFDIAEI